MIHLIRDLWALVRALARFLWTSAKSLVVLTLVAALLAFLAWNYKFSPQHPKAPKITIEDFRTLAKVTADWVQAIANTIRSVLSAVKTLFDSLPSKDSKVLPAAVNMKLAKLQWFSSPSYKAKRSEKSRPSEASLQYGKVFPYKVMAGDTLTRLANYFKTTPKQIKNFNHLRTDKIIVGKTLMLPKRF